MRISSIRLLSLAFLANVLVAGMTPASDLLKNRARWEWSLPDSKISGHTFTGWVGNGLTVGGKAGSPQDKRPQLGQWKITAPGEIQLTITKKDHPLHGTIQVKQTQADPKPVYEGEIVHSDGKKEKIVLELFKD